MIKCLQEYLVERFGEHLIPLPGQKIRSGELIGLVQNILIQLIGEDTFICRIVVLLNDGRQVSFEIDDYIDADFSIIDEEGTIKE